KKPSEMLARMASLRSYARRSSSAVRGSSPGPAPATDAPEPSGSRWLMVCSAPRRPQTELQQASRVPGRASTHEYSEALRPKPCSVIRHRHDGGSPRFACRRLDVIVGRATVSIRPVRTRPATPPGHARPEADRLSHSHEGADAMNDARNVIQDIRAQLEPLDLAIRNHPYLDAVARGAVS